MLENPDILGPACAEPVKFREPELGPAAIKRLPVVIREGKVAEQVVLQTLHSFFELGRVIREAIYGQVNHAIVLGSADGHLFYRTNPPRQVAIKVYSKERLRIMQGQTQENPLNELAAAQHMGPHPHVMVPFEYCSDADNIYAIMDFCDGGELYEIVEESGAMHEHVARGYFKQILLGLAHIHSKSISHRDLSLENVLYSRSTRVCKIIDFGMCLSLPRSDSGQVMLVPPQGVCGKRNYIAPEVLENRLPYNSQLCDVWALGVILFIMLTGVPPVDAATPLDPRFRMVCSGMIKAMLDQWGITLSLEAVDLLQRILRPVPEQRLTLQQISEHAWIHL